MTLRVTLEIVPFGNEDEKYTIEYFNISNIGNLGDGVFKYIVEDNTYKDPESDLKVEHVRSHGALLLVSKALEDLHTYRNLKSRGI